MICGRALVMQFRNMGGLRSPLDAGAELLDARYFEVRGMAGMGQVYGRDNTARLRWEWFGEKEDAVRSLLHTEQVGLYDTYPCLVLTKAALSLSFPHPKDDPKNQA